MPNANANFSGERDTELVIGEREREPFWRYRMILARTFQEFSQNDCTIHPFIDLSDRNKGLNSHRKKYNFVQMKGKERRHVKNLCMRGTIKLW
jgi:hypothetical protein